MPDPIPFEQLQEHAHFKHLSGLKGARIDLRYASENNFVGRNLYAPMDCNWLHEHAFHGLGKSIEWLSRNAPGYSLQILDALRPHRIQEILWQQLAATPLQMYLANPERGSIHSYGMAVDVNLLDANEHEIDMGSAFDEMDERSHPEFESQLQSAGKLSDTAREHRQLLRAAMHAGNFNGIRTEWWHFDCGDREQVRKDYARVL
jgi:zinc D-Ala-D-Ala dipeptidase